MFRLLEKYRNSPAHKYINSSQLEEDLMEAAKSMTNKEAKSKFLLEYCPELCNDYKGEGSCDNCEINVAIKALEKQIPKKPTLIKIPNTSFCKAHIRYGCPICGKHLNYGELLHCGECGQAIDWSEEE